MRVAFLSTVHTYPLSGADTLWIHAAEWASARGDSLFLGLSTQVAAHPRVQELVRQGARLVLSSPPAPPISWSDRAGRLAAAHGMAFSGDSSALTAFAPDLALFSCGGTYDLVREGGWQAWLQHSRTPFRIIANWQSEAFSLSARDASIAASLFTQANHLFFVSQRNLDLTRHHLSRPLPHASVIHNPLRPPPAQALPWPQDQPTTFACVARLEPVKGIDLLLTALASLKSALGNWKLNVFGEGSSHDALVQQANDLELSSHISWRGYVSTLSEIWKDAHLLVSPARDEGGPMTLPEAMFHGRPVLATQVGAATEWIKEGETGFLCSKPDVASLKETLLKAVLTRQQWQTMGLKARDHALQQYRPHDYQQILSPIEAVF